MKPSSRTTQLLAHLIKSAPRSPPIMASASASVLALSPQQHKSAFFTPDPDAAVVAKATELLQQNHDRYHMYFNDSGFHNHLAHHILALYAFNAPPEVLKKQYDANTSYQRPMKPVDPKALENLEDPVKFKHFLYQRDHYHDYLALFEAEIQKIGLEATLAKYLFGPDERARDMLDRLFAGILHPVIHLGYGLEWEQPAIVAEALAQTATHDAWPGDIIKAIEMRRAEVKSADKPLSEIMHDIANNARVQESVRYNDDLRVRDGTRRAGIDEVASILAQWGVNESNLEHKMSEVANFTAAMVAGGQREDHAPRVDFTLMHCANAAPLVAAAAAHPAVSTTAKVQLVQRFGWYSLLSFPAQGSPVMRFQVMRDYKPSHRESNWLALAQRAFHVPDDGHIIKLLRALYFSEHRSKQLPSDYPGLLLQESDFLAFGNVVVDIAEKNHDVFIRGSGFDRSW